MAYASTSKMIPNNLKQNEWKVPPDNTVQVVDPHGIKARTPNDSHNWNGIWISLGIITVVCFLVAIAEFVLIPLHPPPFQGRRICLSDLSDPDIVAVPSSFQWLSEDEIAYISETDGIILMNIGTKKSIKLLSNTTLRQTEAVGFFLSSNRKHILLIHDVIKGRLYTQTAKYRIYDIDKNLYYPLKLVSGEVDHPRFQHVQWIKDHRGVNPQNNEGAELLIISGNDIYYLVSPTGPTYKITHDGYKNVIYNGVPDLVYEEILRSSSSVWFSPSGLLLAFASFNNTAVSELPILKYDEISLPSVVRLRYATVSTPIPELKISIYDVAALKEGKIRNWLLHPPFSTNNSHYLVGAGWSNDSEMWLSYVSRDQRTALLTKCQASTSGNCTLIYSNYQKDGVSPVVQNVVWEGPWAAFPWPIKTNNRSWRSQVILLGERGGKPPPLPLENYDVNKVLTSSPIHQCIYFLGSKISESTFGQQLYKVTRKTGLVQCISCVINCKRTTAELNPALTYAAVTCINTHLPSIHLIDLQNHVNHLSLHTQPILRNKLKEIALPIQIIEDIDLSSEIQASVNLKIPPDWKKDDDSFMFPLVVQIVGIENFIMRDGAVKVDWSELLPSGHHVAHAQIHLWGNHPSKSSSPQSVKTQMAIVIRHLVAKYPFLNKDQVFGWGWGSGASVALMLSGNTESHLFKCVAAINPIYDWKHYASFWAERLLGPLNTQYGRSNYEESHLSRFIGSLNQSHVMLVQNTGDPLSHHSYRIVESFVNLNVQFRHVVYPDSSLALHVETRRLIRSMLNFFLHPDCIENYFVEDPKKC